ncbi:MAG: CBS domain-containing protein [Nitrosopumilales archaeon]|nr:CBS domain-containing protein [Nitrosopumilales archaeon]MRN69261.1 CBS domain-containing protein [Nitrosopumilales archaeon]
MQSDITNMTLLLLSIMSSNVGIESVSVSSIMTKDVKTAKENQTLHSVCRVMHDNNVGSVVIVKDEELHSMNNYIL